MGEDYAASKEVNKANIIVPRFLIITTAFTCVARCTALTGNFTLERMALRGTLNILLKWLLLQALCSRS